MNSKKAKSPTQKVHIILRPLTVGDSLHPEYVIESLPASIGRHPTNDVELPFDAVSRYHARLEHYHGKIRLVDLQSSNGTFINGKRVQIARVEDQDTIIIGQISLTISTMEQPRAALKKKDSEETSVQFLQLDDQTRAVYKPELPDDISPLKMLDAQGLDERKLRILGHQLNCFYRLHDLLNTVHNEKALCSKTLDLLFEVLPADRGVFIIRNSEDLSLYRPVALKTRGKHGPGKINISKTILQRSLKERLAILSEDTSRSEARKKTGAAAKAQRSVICAPMVSGQTVLGFIHLETMNAVHPFTPDDLKFLSNIGVEIALHIHNIRMLNDRITSERMTAIGQTITGMAHNIKNILVLSQGGTDMMDKRLKDKNYEALDETWHLVRRSLDRVNKLTKDMLDFSRARTVERHRVDVNAILRELAATFSEELDRRGVRCDLQLDDKCPPVMLDADGLDKALVNLIVNAMEACPEDDGRVCLRTSLNKNGQLIIEVEDNGEGIPPEVQPRIFVPFFTTKGSQGTGLGLAMTRKFIDDMGGRIDLKSAEGQGTRFTITLTIDPTTPPEAEFSNNDTPPES